MKYVILGKEIETTAGVICKVVEDKGPNRVRVAIKPKVAKGLNLGEGLGFHTNYGHNYCLWLNKDDLQPIKEAVYKGSTYPQLQGRKGYVLNRVADGYCLVRFNVKHMAGIIGVTPNSLWLPESDLDIK